MKVRTLNCLNWGNCFTKYHSEYSLFLYQCFAIKFIRKNEASCRSYETLSRIVTERSFLFSDGRKVEDRTLSRTHCINSYFSLEVILNV